MEGNKVMKEKLINQKEKPIFFIKKAMNSYIDALAQETDSLELRAKILGNRALINMWLKNYGKVIDDCVKALSINKNNIKLYVRATEAFLKLEKYDRCIKFADKGLEIDPNQKALLEMKNEAQKAKNKLEGVLDEKAEMKKKKLQILVQVCTAKGIVLGQPSDFPLPPVYSVI